MARREDSCGLESRQLGNYRACRLFPGSEEARGRSHSLLFPSKTALPREAAVLLKELVDGAGAAIAS